MTQAIANFYMVFSIEPNAPIGCWRFETSIAIWNKANYYWAEQSKTGPLDNWGESQKAFMFDMMVAMMLHGSLLWLGVAAQLALSYARHAGVQLEVGVTWTSRIAGAVGVFF
jgi:hypothetical protein